MSKKSDRSISISVILSVVLLLSFLLLFSPPLHAQSLNLTIGNYQLVSSKRISSTVWEYTYRANITNGSSMAAMGVTATVRSLLPTAKLIDSVLNFGNVAANTTQTSTDTFILQIDRRYPLNLSDLSWTINNVVCAPLDKCHVAGTYDPTTGLCSNPPAADGTPCNDGNPSTHTDTCQAGVCAGSAVVILNPYRNQVYFYKGQTHAHSDRSDGEDPPGWVMAEYGSLGYQFVALTDHDIRKGSIWDLWQQEPLPCNEIFSDPGFPGVTYIPSEEGGMHTRTHLIELGLTKENPCRPEQFSDGHWVNFDLKRRIEWVEYVQHGVAVAAHPGGPCPEIPDGGHAWIDEEVFNIPWLRGIEITHKSPWVIFRWDLLLRADRPRWGLASDDSHHYEYMNQGFVVVNSEFYPALAGDIIFNIKHGNFYSVYLAYQPQTFPQINRIYSNTKLGQESITVEFTGAVQVDFIDRYGHSCGGDWVLEGPFHTDKCRLFDDDGQTHSITYPITGSEGYVRFELLGSNGAVTFSQPLFVHGPTWEDCLYFDYKNATVVNVSIYPFNIWAVVANDQYISFFWGEAAARQALSIIQDYKIDKKCSVGGAFGKMTYFLSGDQSPIGPQPNEDCISIGPEDLSVRLDWRPNEGEWGQRSWQVFSGLADWVLDFADSEILARRAFEIINRYQFSQQCFVGGRQGMMYMTYFRK